MSSVGVESCGIQYGALPWRRLNGELQILLLTTLNTRRWIVPKGWPVPGLSAPNCARLEALEEAGVSGEIGSAPIGSFRYLKRRRNGAEQECHVEVFPLEVTAQQQNWPEKGQRDTCWCSVDDALARVSDPGLQSLIAQFAQSVLGEEQVR